MSLRAGDDPDVRPHWQWVQRARRSTTPAAHAHGICASRVFRWRGQCNCVSATVSLAAHRYFVEPDNVGARGKSVGGPLCAEEPAKGARPISDGCHDVHGVGEHHRATHHIAGYASRLPAGTAGDFIFVHRRPRRMLSPGGRFLQPLPRHDFTVRSHGRAMLAHTGAYPHHIQ